MFFKRKRGSDFIDEKDVGVIHSKDKRILANIIQILIVFIGVVSSIFTFSTSFEVNVSKPIIIIFSLLFTVMWCYIFSNLGKRKYKLLALLIIVVIIGIILGQDIFEGTKYTIKYVQARIAFRNYSGLISDINIEVMRVMEMFILLCSFIISGIISLIIKYKPNILLCLLITFPVVELGIYYTFLPSDFYFALIISFWLSVLAMQINNKKVKNNKRGIIVRNNTKWIKLKVGLIMFIISVLLFIVSCLIYPPSKYTRNPELNELKVKIEHFAENLSLDSFINIFSDTGSGGVYGGILGEVGSLVYDNRTDLEVTIPNEFTSNIYLRGFSGAEYTGNQWKNIDKEIYSKKCDKLSILPINFLYSSLDSFGKNSNCNKYYEINHSEINIKNLDASSDYIYFPYGGFYKDKYFYNDEYIRGDREKTEYSFNYYEPEYEISKLLIDESTNKDNKELKKYLDNELLYRDYVYDIYTKLPKGKVDKVNSEFEGYSDNHSIDECIEKAKERVLEGTKYDLKPGTLPEGKDFVEYFLYENKKGYCSHYASAATVILRAMGIPARYVEGYVLTEKDLASKDTKINGDSYKINSISKNYNKYIMDNNLVKVILRKVPDDIDTNDLEDDYVNYNGKRYFLSVDIVSMENNDIDIQDIKILSNNTFSCLDSIYTFEEDKSYGEDEIKQLEEFYNTEVIPVKYSKVKDVNESEGSSYYNEINYNSYTVTVSLKDSSAHAWVEVYYDEIGWVPIEVTPTSNYSDIDNPNNDTENNQSKSENKDGNEEQKDDVKNNIEDNKGEKGNTGNITIINIVIILGCIVFLSSMFIVIKGRINHALIKKSFKDKNKNNRVKNIYKYILNMIQFLGTNIYEINLYREFALKINEKYSFINKEEFLLITDLYLKSEFSKEQLDDSEINKMISYSYELNDIIWRRLSRRKKFVFLIIKGLR